MFSSVHTLIEDRVAGTTGLPVLQRENTRITPAAGSPWSRFTMLPAQTQQESLGITGKDRLIGFAQLDLFYPADSGTATANAMADAVIAHIPRGLILEDMTVRVVIQTSWRGIGQRVDQYYQVPISISWRAHSL